MDKIIGIVDGSGVLFYNSKGLNREELVRLANSRLMIFNFNPDKPGPKGFKILIEEYDVKLPSMHPYPSVALEFLSLMILPLFAFVFSSWRRRGRRSFVPQQFLSAFSRDHRICPLQ